MITVLLYILGIVVILIGLAISIGLHEVGHLVPAKLFGVKVTQYMVGFGKTVWSRKKGETEYGVKMLPLGGYISMIGMFPPGKDGQVRDSSTGFLQTLSDERPAALRGHGAAETETAAVHDAGAALAADAESPADAGTEPTQRRFFGQLVQDARESSAETIGEGEDHRAFYRLPVWKRIIIMLGGPLMNLFLAVLFMSIVVMGFGLPQSSTTVQTVNACVVPAGSTATDCGPDSAPSPGAEAGLKPGDKLISLGGTAITSWAQATEIIRVSPGKTLDLVVERAGEDETLKLTPLLTKRYVLDAQNRPVKDADGKLETEEVGFVGIGPGTETVQGSFGDVFPLIGNNIGAVANTIIHLPQRLYDVAVAAFGGGERDPNGPLSVVGVGRIAGEVVSNEGVSDANKAAFVFNLLGSLNVALFAFNLIPLMPLDGGHVAAALWEGLRRRLAKLFGRPDPGPVDAAKMMPLTLLVAGFFGIMTVLLVFADLVNPVRF
ncbi:RIP metalloprotease [Mycetocola tolaasinivorans]|uniref:RIP metalloprotease n=1 Tax=Mycetocola tolaasinivorans TaxID=76635 RepID=A0A3L7A4C9_9MICO|nr:site-2 protease family protein [Mycetocola tolaasinivorans]RLP74808.1 RIP metalloprotease [Mycetocola tolaasinivorans]